MSNVSYLYIIVQILTNENADPTSLNKLNVSWF